MTTPSTLSLSEIIQGCIGGNRQSQKELFDLIGPDLYVVCLKYSRNRVDAEKVFEQGFIKLFTNIATFHGKVPFQDWYNVVFVNTALSIIKERPLMLQFHLSTSNDRKYYFVSTTKDRLGK
jgi:RNA polymerase sigma-70 factor (ECF subfamily)